MPRERPKEIAKKDKKKKDFPLSFLFSDLPLIFMPCCGSFLAGHLPSFLKLVLVTQRVNSILSLIPNGPEENVHFSRMEKELSIRPRLARVELKENKVF